MSTLKHAMTIVIAVTEVSLILIPLRRGKCPSSVPFIVGVLTEVPFPVLKCESAQSLSSVFTPVTIEHITVEPDKLSCSMPAVVPEFTLVLVTTRIVKDPSSVPLVL